MRVSLPYAGGRLAGDSEIPLRLIEPRWPRALPGPALTKRFPKDEITAFLGGKRSVALILPDQTRRCDAPALLERLAPVLAGRRVTLLTANGIHPAMDPRTLAGLYGAKALGRWPLVQHDPDRDEDLVDVGLSPKGNRVRLHRLAVEADAVLALSSISFHYFAGFGGARKLLLPGIAARDSIAANHRLVLSEPNPGAGILRGNPLHAEFRWVESLFAGRLYHLVVGLDGDYRAAGIWCGEGGKPLLRASRWLRRKQAVPLEHHFPFAVISCGGSPKDINLIQAHKSLEFAHRAVKPGGVLLFAAACAQGVGSDQFLSWFRFVQKGGGEEPWRDDLLRNYQVSGQTALRWHMKSQSHEIWMLTELSAGDFAPLGARRLASFQEGLDLLRARFPHEEGLLIPHAASVLPVVRREGG